MDDLLQDENLLVRYLDGELTTEERASLEERLQKDARLKEQLLRLQLAIQAIKHQGTAQKVSAVHTKMMRELKPKQPAGRVLPFRKTIRYAMAVAASILILFIGVRIYSASQLSADKLYNESFVDFTVSTSRGNNTVLSKVEQYYQQKDYAAVVNATRSTKLDAKDSLLIGLSYLHTARPDRAISFFQRVASFEGDFRPDGEFYLALSYLKTKQYNNALPVLQKINNDPGHLYHSRVSSDLIENVMKLSKD
ncbi:MAG TPA: tetratricopeptide repeat protein [Flavisolibacter sp.]